MDDIIMYPCDDLQTTGTTQSKNLNEAWLAHLTHLNQHILQPVSQLSSQGGDTFHQHMRTWSQNLGKYYEAFSTFANLLNTSGIQMGSLDKNLGQIFEPGTLNS
jgi:uncharacterized protein YukE